MRNAVAKRLKKTVALAMYVGEGVSEADVLKGRKSVYSSSDFKPVYRARKKKHNNPHHATNVVEYPTKPGAKFPGKQKREVKPKH
jgi:outer membrane protein assembly factor BamA